jgi:hypothetical protein
MDQPQANDELERLEKDSDSAPEDDRSEDLPDDNDEAAEDKDPKGYTKAINRKHFELEEERRKSRELQERLARLEQGAQGQRPVIPDLPDPYDDGFDEKIKARDEAIAEAAAWDGEQTRKQTAEQASRREAMVQQQTELLEIVQTYGGRAKALGISEKDLQVAGQTVNALGISDDLSLFILGDEAGPAITLHLAENPEELANLANMNPMRAAVYLETKIKPRAVGNRRSVTDAPDPAETLGGGGSSPSERGPKGATYE